MRFFTTTTLLFALFSVGFSEEGENVTASTVASSGEEELQTTESGVPDKAAPPNIPEIKPAHELGMIEQQPSESEQGPTEEPPLMRSKEIADDDVFADGESTNATSKESAEISRTTELFNADSDDTETTTVVTKEAETIQSTSAPQTTLTSTSFFSEDTLPAEVTAADPFATTATIVTPNSTSTETESTQMNATTLEITQQPSSEATSTESITTESTTPAFIIDEEPSTNEEESSSLTPLEADTFTVANPFFPKVIENEHVTSSSSTPSTSASTTETTHIETATIAHIDVTSESENRDEENADESLFVGDKSLFNQEQTMKELTTVNHIPDEQTPRPQTTLRGDVEMFESARTEAPQIHSVDMKSTAETSISFSVGTPPAIIPVMVPKEPSPSDFEVNTENHGETNVHAAESKPSEEMEGVGERIEKLPSENLPTEVDLGETHKNVNHFGDSVFGHVEPKPELTSESRPVDEDEGEPHEHHFGVQSAPEPAPEPTKEIERVEEPNDDEEFGRSRLKPEPEPTAGPNQEPQPNPEPKPEPGATAEPTPFGGTDLLRPHRPHQPIHPTFGAFKTPFSFRIISIDYTREFEDPDSGKSKKLRDQLIPDLEEIFGAIFTNTYQGVSIDSITKGSVVIDGHVYTSVKPEDTEQRATEFEQRVTAKGAQIGGNDVDIRSVSLNGFVSKNYVERIHEGYTSGGTSAYVIGGGIAVGIIAILLVAFAVIAMNNRRTNGTLKLKEENIAMAENGRSPWNNTSPVNLMGYGNGHHQLQSDNGQPPMVMIGS